MATMSDHIDPKLVQMACMADLSRARQDELPLSELAKRPTFLPGKGTGTSHIAKDIKIKLVSKWGGESISTQVTDVFLIAVKEKIQDEESEQMEGLATEDSRPWAKKFTNQYMKHHQAESAPPQLAHRPNITKLPNAHKAVMHSKPPTKTMTATTNSPSLTITSAPTIHVVSNSQQKAKATKAVTATMTTPFISSAKGSSSKTTSCLVNSDQTKISLKPLNAVDVHEHVLCQGQCQVMAGPVESNRSFRTEFCMKVHLKTNQALLVLTAPGKIERVHNVLDLDAPSVQRDFCFVTDLNGEVRYRLKFNKPAETENFNHYLRSLQRSAAQHMKEASSAAEPAPLPIVKKPHNPRERKSHSLLSNSNTHVKEPGITSKKDARIIQKAVEELATGKPEKSLIDIEDNSMGNGLTTGENVPELSIDDAADHLQGLVQSILHNISECGVQVSEQTVNEVEDEAIDSWVGKGFLKSASDDMKDELLQLLRVLVRIKRKTEFRLRARMVSCSSLAVEELRKAPQKSTTRIQYTTDEIKRLEGLALSRRKEIENSGLPQRLLARPATSMSTASRPERRIVCSEEDIGWQPTVTLPVSKSETYPFQGLATSRWASQNSFSASAKTPAAVSQFTPQASLSAHGGLGSSRWADKPVAFEGQFAG